MGNSISNQNQNQNELENKKCLICWELVEAIDLVQCFRCNIYLHVYCEETYRNTRKYCKCPHCQSIGTMVTSKITLLN